MLFYIFLTVNKSKDKTKTNTESILQTSIQSLVQCIPLVVPPNNNEKHISAAALGDIFIIGVSPTQSCCWAPNMCQSTANNSSKQMHDLHPAINYFRKLQ